MIFHTVSKMLIAMAAAVLLLVVQLATWACYSLWMGFCKWKYIIGTSMHYKLINIARQYGSIWVSEFVLSYHSSLCTTNSLQLAEHACTRILVFILFALRHTFIKIRTLCVLKPINLKEIQLYKLWMIMKWMTWSGYSVQLAELKQ